MYHLKPLVAAVLFSLLTLVLAQEMLSAETAPAESSLTTVHRFADLSEVEYATSTLIRTDNGVAMELRTEGLEPYAPYTVWWVVFNTPQGCSESCDEDDIIDAEGNMAPNPEANISILWATGGVTSAEGKGVFSAYLPENQPLGEVLFGPTLIDARGAEVHLVVRTHGAADLDRLYAQFNTFEPDPAMGGTCDTCTDVQFAVHAPTAALAGN